MPYRGNNYSFVIDSSFQPFTMQEMLVPFTAYKDAFEQSEAAYDDLRKRSDDFKYLSETLPEGSRARQIYEGYANDLNAQAEDFARNGLNMENRSALTNLRQRYQGEIGRLNKADEAYRKELELRRALSTKDSSMLYASDNLGIDDFLDNATPNLYNISGNELYNKGAAAGQAASKRVFNVGDAGSTLGGYYRDYVQRMGYTPEQLSQFGDQIANDFASQVSVLPELQQAANQILEANGVTENLTGNNLKKAQQQVIRGIIDGAVYTESHNPTRDLGVMTPAERAAEARAAAKFNMERRDWEDKRNLMYEFETNEDGSYKLDKNGQRIVKGYRPDILNTNDWEMGPDGKWKKKSTRTAKSPEETASEKKGVALLKLTKTDLANNNGFDVTFGDERHHYDYIGALSKHGDQWYHGALGEDNPGHNFPGAWGWASTSNVENAWGNFSAEGSDSKDMRVLSGDELNRALQEEGLNIELNNMLDEYLAAHGIEKGSPQEGALDIQMIEVPNERGGGNQKGYLIAIH